MSQTQIPTEPPGSLLLSEGSSPPADEGTESSWWSWCLRNTSTCTQCQGLAEGSSLKQERRVQSGPPWKYSSSCNTLQGRRCLFDGQSPGRMETPRSPGLLQSLHPGRGLEVETKERIPKMTSRLRWSREQLGRREKKERSESQSSCSGSWANKTLQKGAANYARFPIWMPQLQPGLLFHLRTCSCILEKISRKQ